MVKPTQKNKGLSQARRAASRGLLFENGWYVLPSRGGVVTSELIEKIQEELDQEDAVPRSDRRDAAGS